MGWNIIAFGQIDVEEKYYEIVLKKFNEIATSDSNIVEIAGDLTFEMSGNKGVSYDSLDELKEWAIKNKIPMTISTSEYSEVGSGYYFDTNDYEAEQEKDEKRIGE